MEATKSRFGWNLAVMITLVAALASLVSVAHATRGKASGGASGPLAVKVLVITMFPLETEPWLKREGLTRSVTVPTVTDPVQCNPLGECVATVGQAKVNAAMSMTAILDDPAFDFRKAYFLTSGIAGTSPEAGTLGFVGLADAVVDYEQGTHVSKETDPSVPDGYIKGEDVGTNVYRLNAGLVRTALELTKHVPLADDATAAANRAHFAGQARKKPFVATCATVTADDFWIGADASRTASAVVRAWVGNGSKYCTTQEEDNATAGALAKHGYLSRYLSVRAASDFDRPFPGQTAAEAVSAFPGADIAVENAYRVSSTIAHHLLGAH